MEESSAELTAGGQRLGTRAARGAVVTIAGQGTRILIQLCSVIVLARLLSPHDYGLFAMVMSIAGVAEIFRDFGLGQAAIQARTLSRDQRDNLFWINAGIGAAVAMCVFAGSWGIAALFGRPELVGLTQMVSVVFLINGVATQYRAGLNRELRFVALAATDIIAAVVALCAAILFATAGLGPWALALQLVVQSGVVLVLLVICSRWVPRWPHRQVPMRGFVAFGWNLVATQLVGYLANNIDTLIVGLRFGTTQLGIYNRAFQLVMNPVSQLQTPATLVALPVLSRLQDSVARYWSYVRLGQVALGYSVVAGLSLVAGASIPLTEILLGSAWTAAAPFLTLMAVAATFNTLNLVAYWVYVSRGITRALFRYSLISLAIKLVCISVGSIWGVIGVAAGFALAPMLSFSVSLWWLSRSTENVPARSLFLGVVRIATVAAVGAGAAYGAVAVTADMVMPARLCFAIVAWAGTYLLIAVAIPPVRRDIVSLRLIKDAFLDRRRAVEDETEAA